LFAATVPEPCHPENDDCQAAWQPAFSRWVDISQDCRVFVYYTYRLCPNTNVELQILRINLYGDCSNNNFDEILQECYYQIIDKNEYWQPPQWPGECADIWRISNYSCWTQILAMQDPNEFPEAPQSFAKTGTNNDKSKSSYDKTLEDNTYIKVYLPCSGGECCRQQYKVCRFSL
jgi:hypothetical protein